MKKCPLCAELIQDEAIKCRYCGSMIGKIGEHGEPPATPALDGLDRPALDESNLYDAVLTYAGNNKISVIKLVREYTHLGLKDAKDLTEAAPRTVLEGLSEQQARSLAERFRAAGAVVEVRPAPAGRNRSTTPWPAAGAHPPGAAKASGCMSALLVAVFLGSGLLLAGATLSGRMIAARAAVQARDCLRLAMSITNR